MPSEPNNSVNPIVTHSINSANIAHGYAWNLADDIATTPTGKLIAKGLGNFALAPLSYGIKTNVYGKDGTEATFELVGEVVAGSAGGTGGAMAGAAIGSAVPVVGTVIGGIIGFAAGSLFGSYIGQLAGQNTYQTYQDINDFLGDANTITTNNQSYVGLMSDGAIRIAYRDGNGSLQSFENSEPQGVMWEGYKLKSSIKFSQTDDAGNTVAYIADAETGNLTSVSFNMNAQVADGQTLKDLAESFSQNTDGTSILDDGSTISVEGMDGNGNPVELEKIWTNDSVDELKAKAQDSGITSELQSAEDVADAEGNVLGALLDKNESVTLLGGIATTLGKVTDMLFSRDGVMADFISRTADEYKSYYQSEAGEILFANALTNLAVRLANGEDFDDIVGDVVLTLLATPGISTFLEKNLPDHVQGTTYEAYLTQAISAFMLTSILNGGEDMTETAQNVSVQQAVSYTLANGLSDLFGNPAGQTASGENIYSLNAAGAGAAAAVLSLATQVLDGNSIGEEEIGQAAIAGATAYAASSIGSAVGSLVTSSSLFGSSGLSAGAVAGPVGIVVGFAIGMAVQELLAPKVHDDTTQSHKVVDQGDGTVQLVGLREAGSLLRTGGDTDDDFLGNDSVDDTSGHDVIVGQAGANEIYALGGHDFIEGRANADYIEAGTGNDHVEAGSGDDYVDGGAGSDKIYGGLGDDNIIGGEGDDILLGGEGDDLLEGGLGNDKIFGAEGVDTVSGGAGNDEISGGSGDDVLSGDDGVDTIDGGSGSDEIYGDDGDDVLYGGEGNDTMRGGNDNDLIFGETGVDMLYGNAGDDIIDGGSQSDLAFGGIGSDTLIGGYGSDDLYGEIGNDLLIGGRDNDTLDGGDGDDVYLYNLGDGDDTIIDTDGANALKLTDIQVEEVSFNQVGNNLQITMPNGDVVTVQDFFTTANLDEVEFADGRTVQMVDVSFDVVTGVGTVGAVQAGPSALVTAQSSGIANYQMLTASWAVNALPSTTWFTNNYDVNADPSTWQAEQYNDVQVRTWHKSSGWFGMKKSMGFYDYHQKFLKGSAVDDRIVGMFWSETILGEGGNDQLYGNGDLDTLDGGDDHDILFGGEDADTMQGGNGTDMLIGGHGDDLMYGESDNDTLFGEWGNDTMSGGLGDDFIEGGFGDDTISGDEGDDLLFGDEGDDTIQGGAGRDYIEGGIGNDTIAGGSEDDFILGGLGDDDIDGGDGDDVLIGGAGNDVIAGGAGTDTAIFTGNASDYTMVGNADGSYTITDTRVNSLDGIDTVSGVEKLQFNDAVIETSSIFPDQHSVLKMGMDRVFEGELTLPAGYTLQLVSVDDGIQVDLLGGSGFRVTSGPVADDFGFVYRLTSPDGVEKDYQMTASILKEEMVSLSEGQVNTYTASDQNYSAISSLSGGGYVVVWQSSGQDGSGTGIYAQMFNVDGTKNGSEFLVNTTTAADQFVPYVAGSPNGGFAVVWESDGAIDGSGQAVLMQRFDSNGIKVGSEVLVNTTTAGHQQTPDIAALSDGKYVVVWKSLDTNTTYGVYSQLFNADGTKSGSETLVNVDVSWNQKHMHVSALNDGGYAVSWTDGNGNGYERVYMRLFNSQGSALTSDIFVSETTNANNSLIDVSSLSDGRVVAVWEGANYDLYGRIFNADGTAHAGEFVISAGNMDRARQRQSVTALRDGGFLAVYEGYNVDGSRWAVMAQRYDGFGGKVGEEFVVNDFTYHSQSYPDVALLENGDVAVSWTSYTQDGSAHGVYQKVLRFTETGLFEADLALPENGGIFSDTDASSILTGSAFADAIHGNGGDDTLLGNGGDDTLKGGEGDDILDGDEGSDAAVYTGNIADYTIQAFDDAYVVTDNVGSEGTDTLTGIEELVFADTRLDIANLFPEHEGSIQSAQGTLTSGQLALPAGYSITLESAPENGMLVLNADGSYTYSSIDGDASTNTFSYKLTSPQGIEKIYTMFIEVVNKADSGDSYTDGGEELVAPFRDYYQSGQENNERQAVSVTDLDSGGYVIVWSSAAHANTVDDGSGFGVVAQIYDENAIKVGSEFVVNSNVSNYQYDAHVTSTRDGGFIVSWVDLAQDGSGSGVYMQRYDEFGIPVGLETQIHDTTAGHQLHPETIELSDGNILATWTTSSGVDGYDILMKIFDINGNTILPEQAVNTVTANTQRKSSVLLLKDGGYVISWEDHGASDGSAQAVKYRVYEGSGLPRTDELLANSFTYSQQRWVSSSSLADGSFILSWTSRYQDQGSGYGVFAQRISASGIKIGGEIQLNTHTADHQQHSKIVGLSDGGFFAVWMSGNQDSSSNGVYGQRFDANGNKLGTEIQLNETIANFQRFPAITETENGSLVVTWQDYNGTPNSVMQKMLISDGEGGVLLSGYEGADILSGGNYADHLYGKSGDDRLVGNAGNDGLYGGDGNDTAVFNGNLADYNLTFNGNAITVEDTVGSDGVDTLDSIEYLEFADTTLDVAALFPEQVSRITSVTNGVYQGQIDVPVGYTVSIVSGPENGNFVLNADGSYVYTAPANKQGADKLSYQLVSGTGFSKIYTVDVTLTASASEDYVNGTEEVVGTYYHYSGWSDYQQGVRPRMVSLANGGHVVMWSTNASSDVNHVDDGAGTAVVGRVYDNNRNAVGDTFVINEITTSHQNRADMVALKDGGFISTWYSTATDVNGVTKSSYMRRFDNSGNAVTGDILVATNTSYKQLHPRLTELSNGNIAFTWASEHSGNWDIYHKVLDVDGNTVVEESRVNEFISSSQYYPAITYLNDGGYVISWDDQGASDGDGYGIKYRVFNADGTTRTEEMVANTYTASHQKDSTLTALASGGFVITWSSNGQDGSNYGIYAQRFDASGGKQGSEIQVNTYTTSHQDLSDVTALSDGGFYVVWHSNGQDGSNYGVYGQRFDRNGSAVGDELQINDTVTTSQFIPTVEELANGDLAIAWLDWNSVRTIRQKILVSDNAGGAYLVGTDEDDVLVGAAGADTLVGALGNDTLSGGLGDDVLIGGDGDDTYHLSFGEGDDMIDNQDSLGLDTVKFQNGEENHSLWFSREGFDLRVDYLDNTGSATFKNWYVSDAQKVDAIELSNGTSVDRSGINQLVSAMAGFDPALFANADELSDLPQEVQDSITASWV